MKELVYITSHPIKAERLSVHLKRPVKHFKIDLPEIQSLDVEAVVRHKAEAAFAVAGVPVLVEDFSLRIFVLGKLPGPLIKWFSTELGAMRICELIKAGEDRSALASIAMGYCDGSQSFSFVGERNGHIATEPRGTEVWGPDTIFIPEGWDKTWAEMTEAEQMESSVRRLALQKLEAFLGSSK